MAEAPFTDRLKEKLEVLAGDRGDPTAHALRAGRITDIEALIGSLDTGTREIATRVTALLIRIATAEADLQAALAQLGDLQADLADLPRGSVRFSGTVGETVTPANNGDVVIQFTANGTLTFKGRGTDGTVRSGTVTLT